MPRIARTFVTLGAAALVASSAMGQDPQPRREAPARPAGQPPAAGEMQAKVPNPAEMNALLADWAKQNGTLRSLTVGFVRTDTSAAWGKEEYVGNAYLQSPNLACLHFKKVDRANPKKPTDHERIVCTGQEVRQYDYKTQQIFVFPLDKNERKRAIQEGPLPFLFNMKADEAKHRYSMTKMDEDKNYYLIGIVPLEPRDKEVFSKAFIQLNKRSFLPDRLLLVDPNGKDTQDYKFEQVSADTPVNPVYFQALKIKGWKEVSEHGAGAARSGRCRPGCRAGGPSPGGDEAGRRGKASAVNGTGAGSESSAARPAGTSRPVGPWCAPRFDGGYSGGL